MRTSNPLFRSARSRLTIFLLFAVLLLALIACRRSEDQAWQRAQQTGTLRVGMDAAYPPFEYVNEQNQIVGFDVDLATEIAARLGFEVEFVNIPYDGLYDALDTGQVDMLTSGLVAGWAYEAKANFSSPYFNAGEHLLVPTGSTISDMQDLDGRILAVEYGSGGDVEARRWERRLADLTIERFTNPTQAVDAVISGQVDAALVDGITASLASGQNPDLTIAVNVTDQLFAIAVGEESTTLLQQVNRTLDELRDDGTLRTLQTAWFGPHY